VEAGVTYFDTAHLYPGNEQALGASLAKLNLRGRVEIATKLPHFRCRKPADFDRFFNESLTRLGTDYTDHYLVHNIGSVAAWRRLTDIGICEWIAGKKATGEIRQIGFSFHGKAVEFLPLLEAYPWEFAMIQLNYMNENFQAGLSGLKALAERGLPAIIMEPLLGGKLATGLPREAVDALSMSGSYTPAQQALRWLFDKPEVSIVLSGMNTEAQLSENLAVADMAPGALSEAERAVFRQVQGIVEKTYKIPCTGCNYCMPCPQGVNIPACFTSYNLSHAVGRFSGYSLYFNSTLGIGTTRCGAGSCNRCGVCVKKCPQDIDIPAGLRDVYRRMEPLPLRPAIALVKSFFR
jgi:predicted aldo/keto reductase-like oxidoreductase